MKKQIKISFLYTVYATIGLGVIYPITLSAIGLLIPSTPPSLLKAPIERQDLFHGRPSQSSGASNLALTSKELAKKVEERAKVLSQENPGVPIPRDLLFASGSGYDPDISVEAARFQIPRIAKARKMDISTLEKLIVDYLHPKTDGIIGNDFVDVTKLNQALEKNFAKS